MIVIVHILSALLVLTGLVFFLGAAIGVVRFPDFYTRMHAAGKGDTLSTILILLGVCLYVLTDFSAANVLVALKVLGIAILIMLTSPTSTHALMQAGYDDGIRPFTRSVTGEEEEESEGG